jgi:hypothetical protein
VFRKRTTEADTCSEGQDVLKIARMGKDIPDLMEAVLGFVVRCQFRHMSFVNEC